MALTGSLLAYDFGGCPVLRRSRFFDLLREMAVKLPAVAQILL